MPKKTLGKQSRRSFLKQSAAIAGAALFPNIIPSTALGLDGAVAPSNRITVGFIGIGKMAKGHHGAFLGDNSTQVLAICDVERGRREAAAQRTNEHYAQVNDKASYKGCDNYLDFREICARQDIDAMVIATPNHWHALCAVEAAKNGKDIYLEKPLTRCIDEGKVLINAVRKYGRILQVGSQQRSDNAFRFACEMVRNGRIGKVHTVYVNVGGPPVECYLPEQPVPEGLDWNFWLGPAPWRPYNADIAPPESYDGWPNWRAYRDYAGGGMDDFGAHHYDIAQWGLGMDESGPVDVIPPDGKDYTTLTYKYANGITMYHTGGDPRAAVEWVGDGGKVRVNRGGFLETEPGYLQNEPTGVNEIHLYKNDNHKDNWLEGIRTRKEPICTVEIGHRTATICHLGNIAYWLKRPLKWNPEGEMFVGDPEANRLLMRPMRSPWQLTEERTMEYYFDPC